MQKWEYKLLELKGFCTWTGGEQLAKAGKDGWELVGVYYDDCQWIAIFKKPIN